MPHKFARSLVPNRRVRCADQPKRMAVRTTDPTSSRFTCSLFLMCLCLSFALGCQGESENANEETAESSEQSAPMPVAKAIDGTPEISVSTLRKRLGANDRAEFQKAGGKVVAANLAYADVTDLAPLKGQPLKYLDLTALDVSDLSPLKGMPLEELFLEGTQVSDLSPLEGMPLKTLRMEQCPVSDLSPLEGMQLKRLGLFGTKVSEISVVKGMPLDTLWLTETAVTDISVLSKIELESLDIEKTEIADLTPLSGNLELKRLNIADSAVTDLTPLAGLELERLIFTPEKIKNGLDVVKSMPTLQKIGRSFDTTMQPDLFWAAETSQE